MERVIEDDIGAVEAEEVSLGRDLGQLFDSRFDRAGQISLAQRLESRCDEVGLAGAELVGDIGLQLGESPLEP